MLRVADSGPCAPASCGAPDERAMSGTMRGSEPQALSSASNAVQAHVVNRPRVIIDMRCPRVQR